MYYALHAVHGLLLEALCDDIHGNPIPITEPNLISLATKEAEALSLRFMEAAATAQNEAALVIMVNTNRTGCTDLINRVYRHRLAFPHPCLQKLEATLIGNLMWLKQYFASCFDTGATVPEPVWQAGTQVLQQKWNRVRQMWMPIEKQSSLAAGVMQLWEKETANLPAVTGTFRQLGYWQRLFDDLLTITNTEDADTALAVKLIHNNCNDAPLVQLLMNHWLKPASDALSITETLAHWRQCGQMVAHIQGNKEACVPAHLSAKAQVSAAIQRQIQTWQLKEKTLQALYGPPPGADVRGNNKEPLMTPLSVSQMAVFCRLLSDCGLIKHNNHTELLKCIAGAFRTTKAVVISADSLRVKYYAPDRTAVNIVREYLLNMLNQVKQY